jgi:uncharacterized protein (TIGR02611 family)
MDPVSDMDRMSKTARSGRRMAFRRFRETIRSKPAFNTSYRIALGVIGFLILLAGILMIPYPGPGWLILFAGLGILGTEFVWASRINRCVKRIYGAWIDWLGRRGPAVQGAVVVAIGLIVLLTLWLLGVLSTVGEWLGHKWGWLRSPLLLVSEWD